ncbi:phosphatase family protein-like protein [Melanomma pulvis-pyrius CBS 109.77]|uniref:Phosphatase family protein-like protein n=1 Tax=Melanomma pulvis-pyrius CBS 109.77 TaxID=1314802 RepID=A0A6A6XAC5_9PLEO|nr:phosphatase family protein-like protein [Melanomma pulvis-pyrius CBS 109.77]
MPPSDTGSAERLDATIPGAFPGENINQASTQQSLSQALFARRSEYTRPRNVRIKVGSWNVASEKGTEQDIGGWFVGGKGIEESLAGLGVGGPKSESEEPRESVAEQEARSTKYAPTIPLNDDGAMPGGKEIDMYALGLQEVVDITSPTEALRPYTDPAVANRWKSVVKAALPPGYELVAEQQLIGLLLLIYASPAVFPHIKSVSTTSVGTGLMGYMGNKGAVTARMVLGETTRLVFINSHLAAGADKVALDRRNWDAGQVVSRTRFDPIVDSMGLSQGQGERIGEEDFAFWFGDLNYRLEGMPGDDVRRLLTIHTVDLDSERSQKRSSNSNDSGYASKISADTEDSADSDLDTVPLPPDLDPASLQTTITSLLPHDELQQQQKAGKAFHDGWDEGPIRFLPTYKYDIGKVGVFDSSEKRRCPSWCDRILYRTRAARLRYEARAKDQELARKKDEEMKAKGLDHATDDEDVLFDYDPDTDGDNDNYDYYEANADPQPEVVTTKEGFSDEILLEYYTAHMRVLSSDHKPLDAVFALKYDAVIPDLKAKIHQEVARELDRQENEGRPSITLVVDRSANTDATERTDKDSDFDGVYYGDIQYAKSKRRTITIANTGRVPATFGFVDRPIQEGQPEGPFPPWLTVTFDREPDMPEKASSDSPLTQYTLQPADVCNVELRLKIDIIGVVKNLNEETTALDEILVLRVLNGRDHFLPIRGRWLQSSLAQSIDKLIRIPEGGIRKLQHQKPADEGVKWSVPRELFRLTEAIEEMTERTLADWEMTGHETNKAPWQHNAGWPFVKDARYFADGTHEDALIQVYEALDCDQPFDKAFAPDVAPMQRLEIMAEVLLQFLRSLQDGVVTEAMWKRLEEVVIAREKFKQQPSLEERISVLEVLSATPNHNASFVLLTTMLQSIARDIANASKPDPKTPRSSVDLPASPQVSVRRKTLSKVPEVAIRQLINRNYASVFADVIFRSEGMEKLREKERAVRKERMVKVMELFLHEDEGGK